MATNLPPVEQINCDVSYKALLSQIMAEGYSESDANTNVRTGIFAKKLFAVQRRHRCDINFPLTSLKNIFWRAIVEEFIWMFGMGDSNAKYLMEKNINIWNEWPWTQYKQKVDPNISLEDFVAGIKDGSIDEKYADCGPVYGRQFRRKVDASGVPLDQFANVINTLKTKPLCRRNIIAGWTPEQTSQMALPLCHGNHIQFNAEYIDGEWHLDLVQTQR